MYINHYVINISLNIWGGSTNKQQTISCGQAGVRKSCTQMFCTKTTK